MSQEIERKFLVRGEFRHLASSRTRLVQGYLCSVPERTVRVRIAGDSGTITIKGAGSRLGTTRFEWEKSIAKQDAEELLALCEPGVIEKTRHVVEVEGDTFEVDEFHGENAGLVVAEIELDAEDAEFARPEWLGVEVTGEARYYNAALVKHPYLRWEESS